MTTVQYLEARRKGRIGAFENLMRRAQVEPIKNRRRKRTRTPSDRIYIKDKSN